MVEIPFAPDWRNNACDRCPELVACRTPNSKVVVASPCPKGGLLAIGEAPGKDEDREGIGFIGGAGKKLHALLKDNGLSCREYGVANICRCRPPNNRKPTAQEIKACLPFLVSLILECQPKVILAVGGITPTAVLCGPGTLYSKLQSRLASGSWKAGLDKHLAHQGIQNALDAVTYVVPSPQPA